MSCLGFTLIRKLGEGSFGEVYEAQKPGTKERWALKIERAPQKSGVTKKSTRLELSSSCSFSLSSSSSSSVSASTRSSVASLYLRSRSGASVLASLSSAASTSSSSSSSSSSPLSSRSACSSEASDSSTRLPRRKSLGSSTPTGIGTESLLEATITRALRHPNVVFTRSVQLDPEHPTRVVTVCELGRQTLQEYLDLDPNRDDPDVPRAAIPTAPSARRRKADTSVFRAVPLDAATLMSYLSLVHDMASGLQYVHSHNIAHFDLKPENILLFDVSTQTRCTSSVDPKAVDPEAEAEAETEAETTKTTPETEWRVWVAKLADFGLAEKITELEPDQQIGGTLHYRAPEILCPETHTRRHAFAKDRWSLLVMAWSMLFGCHPFASRLDFERMEHERDMLRRIFRRLGYPRARWLKTYVDADARSHLLADGGASSETSGVDTIVRLLKERTGLSYGRWCVSYGEPVMEALMRMFARGFVYEPAERVFDFYPVWRAARVHHGCRPPPAVFSGPPPPVSPRTLPRSRGSVPASAKNVPSSSRLPPRSSTCYGALESERMPHEAGRKESGARVEMDADAKRAEWFRAARKRLPAPIAHDVWEIWCLLLDLKCARVVLDVDVDSHEQALDVRPQSLEYDAIVSLATKLAAFKNDLRYVSGGGRVLDKPYLRTLYARQNQIIDRLGFRFSRSAPSQMASPTDSAADASAATPPPIIAHGEATAAAARLKHLSLRRSVKSVVTR